MKKGGKSDRDSEDGDQDRFYSDEDEDEEGGSNNKKERRRKGKKEDDDNYLGNNIEESSSPITKPSDIKGLLKHKQKRSKLDPKVY